MKKILLFFTALSIVLIFSGCQNISILNVGVNSGAGSEVQNKSNFVNIKYRNDPVDVGSSNFEELNISKSSFVRGAWYDKRNSYMVIKLDGTYYHYCDLPGGVWSKFKKADSFGSYYTASIKGNYDCRVGYVPYY